MISFNTVNIVSILELNYFVPGTVAYSGVMATMTNMNVEAQARLIL